MFRKKPHHTVLMLVENLSVPADPRVWREARVLHEAGFHVCIICPQGTTRDQERAVCLDGIYIYRYPLAPASDGAFGYMREYAQALLQTFRYGLQVWFQHGIDVVHAANPPDMFFLIGLFYRLFGKKYIFDQHDLAPEIVEVKFAGKHRLLFQLMRWLERCSYQVANVVITTNESQKQMALTRGKRREHSVFVVRNGPERARYRPGKAELRLKQGRPYLLLYVGVMGVQDGIEYALRALAELIHTRRHDDVSLVLLGDGEQRSALERLTHTLGLDAYVTFAGWVGQAELLHYLSSADIGLCPDPSNALNDRCTMLKTLEYMAMGKPVVAFDLPETRVSAQEAALYAPANDVHEFATCIELLLQSPELREQMGQYGRRRIVEELCWEQTQKALLQAYDTLLPDISARAQQVCTE